MLLHLIIVSADGTLLFDRTFGGPPVPRGRFLHFGPAISTMSGIASQIAPTAGGGFRVIEFDSMCVEIFTAPTGVLFIGVSTPGSPPLSGLLGTCYRAYATHVVLNPMADPKQPLRAPKFDAAIEAFVKSNAHLFA